MSALVVRGDAAHLPLPDESVDLIVTSPPYFALRSYRDEGGHYAGQIGSEPTPQAFLEALWAVMGECWRVLKPTGSCFVNLGDKRSGSGGHNNSGIVSIKGTNRGRRVCLTCGTSGERHRCSRCQGKTDWTDEVKAERRASRRNAPDRYNQAAFGRAKSKMLLPHRFAIGCEDGLADPEGKGWIVRGDYVWSKANSLPESVVDRCRDSHEYLFHLVKEGRYFAAVDEVREPQLEPNRRGNDTSSGREVAGLNNWDKSLIEGRVYNPLGKLPGSVWSLPSEPLRIPEAVKAHYDLPDHFAAFPTELVRRVVLGWSPSGVCVECGDGRRPVVAKEYTKAQNRIGNKYVDGLAADGTYGQGRPGSSDAPDLRLAATITGYACDCTPYTDHPGSGGAGLSYAAALEARQRGETPEGWAQHQPVDRRPKTGPRREYHLDGWTPPPTRPAVVLDPFSGSGTSVMVARALGRSGIGVDLSYSYCRLGQWRVFQSGNGRKAVNRTWAERQGTLA